MLGNWLKTSLLMAAIMALFGAIGAYIGGATGMLMALLFGGAMNLFAYWFSDTMVLKMYNAQEVDEVSAPQFYTMVRELAQKFLKGGGGGQPGFATAGAVAGNGETVGFVADLLNQMQCG